MGRNFGEVPTQKFSDRPSEAWSWTQTILGMPAKPASDVEAGAQPHRELLEWLTQISAQHEQKLQRLRCAENEQRHQREMLEWLAEISTEHEEILSLVRRKDAETHERWDRFDHQPAALVEGNWDPSKHPRLGGPPNPGWWATTGNAGGATGHSPFLWASVKRRKKDSDAPAPQNSGQNGKPPDGAQRHQGQIPPRPSLNAEGIEVAGAGPETTRSYQDKVQKALEILDPNVARWWKANSVNGLVRSRASWWSSYRIRLEHDTQPVIEVDPSFTAGQTAQAIAEEAKNRSMWPDQVATFYRKYRFFLTNSPEEFRKWQQDAVGEAARFASVLADLYVSGIATLTPSGDIAVTLGDVAENGPRWDQLLSILPLIGHLPIGAIVLKLGKQEGKLPKAFLRKLEKLSEKERKSILAAAASAKNNEEAAAIIRREVDRQIGNRQTHHAISSTVYGALEKHQILRGKYSLRDRRFESLAIDYKAHHGYEDWHRDLDKEVRNWIEHNKDGTEVKFEAWLRERYAKPDLKRRFPNDL